MRLVPGKVAGLSVIGAFVVISALAFAAVATAQNPQAHPPPTDRGHTLAGSPSPPAPHTPWWRDDKIRAGIQLTAAQSDAIQHVFDLSFPGQRTIYASITEAQKTVDALLSQDKPDIASAIVAMQQLEMARFNLSVSRDLMLLRMRQLLSPAQRKTLATIAPQVNFGPKP
jgi:Spy/CpxP family protein refolding chaperone